MELSYRGLLDPTPWTAKGITLPKYDAAAMAEKTRSAPIWVHFGSGNIFRGFIAQLQQTLLNAGLAEKGIIAVDTFDFDIIDKIYTPYDNLTMNVTLNPDATVSCEVMSAVAEGPTPATTAKWPGCAVSSLIPDCSWSALPSRKRVMPSAGRTEAFSPLPRRILKTAPPPVSTR